MTTSIRKAVANELKRFCNRLWPTDVRLISYQGLKWVLDRRNRVDRKIICGGYEQEQVAFLLGQLARGCDCFFDVGANLGLYTLQVAQSGRANRFVAFEPDRRNYAQLMANLYVNGMTGRVDVFFAALSAHEELLDFCLYPQNSTGQSRIAEGSEQDVEKVSVQGYALDRLFSFSGARLAFKLDVEGHEMEALAGAQNLLRNNACLLQIEAWPQNIDRLHAVMRDLGYLHIETIQEDHYFANRGWIGASVAPQ